MAFNMLSDEEFEKLQKRVTRDLTLTKDNVMAKSIELPKLYTLYNRLYNRELNVLRNIGNQKHRLYKKLYHKYKFEGDFRLDTKNEIEVYVLGDDDYSDLRIAYDTQSIIVDFLEKTLKSIQRTSFNIRDYIELQKFKKGIE